MSKKITNIQNPTESNNKKQQNSLFLDPTDYHHRHYYSVSYYYFSYPYMVTPYGPNDSSSPSVESVLEAANSKLGIFTSPPPVALVPGTSIAIVMFHCRVPFHYHHKVYHIDSLVLLLVISKILMILIL